MSSRKTVGLIVNADDALGYPHITDAIMAILDSHFEDTILTQATLMMVGNDLPGKANALVEKAKGKIQLGAHLTTTSEWRNPDYCYRPITYAPKLTCPIQSTPDAFSDAFFNDSQDFQRTAKNHLGAVRRELKAQIECASELLQGGFTHADNHMGSLYGISDGIHIRPKFLKLTLDLCAQYGLSFRLPRRAIPEMLGNSVLDIPQQIPFKILDMLIRYFGTQADKAGVIGPDLLIPFDPNSIPKPTEPLDSLDKFEEFFQAHYPQYRSNFITFMDKIHDQAEGDDVVEIYFHPATFEAETVTSGIQPAQAVTGRYYARIFEYRLLCDPYVKKMLTGTPLMRYQLMSYDDIACFKLKK